MPSADKAAKSKAVQIQTAEWSDGAKSLAIWMAGPTERRKLSELKPYPNNPRTHDQAQIETLAKLIKTFGFTQPMLIDEHDMILAGHGRAEAAMLLGLDEVPVVVRAGLSDADKMAIVIADNQIALTAGWDEAILKGQVVELKKLNFDLDLLGFPELELVEFVSGLGDGKTAQAPAGGDGAQDRDLTEAELAVLLSAWRVMTKEWTGILAKRESLGFVSTSYTKGALAVYFLRARFYGNSIPSAATLAYTPHRVDINGDTQGSLSDFLATCGRRDEFIKSLMFLCQGQPKLDKMLGQTLAIHRHRLPGEFPVDLARSLYDEFCTTPGASVLDPCHGWGGRMLGFLLAKNVSHYTGYDVDPKTYRGVNDMYRDLRKLAAFDKTAQLVCEPFERAKPKSASIDFAMTSPPYFNTEKYGGDESSWKLYPDFDKWVAGFYAPMIQSVARALKPSASFALQIGNQTHPLESTAKEIAGTCGLEYAETRGTGMINNYNKTLSEDGEVIVIFKKKNPA
jgi:hypothetical protein